MGIYGSKTESDLLVFLSKMADEGKQLTDFDIIFEENTKVYLTQCLSYAAINNSRLQNEMKSYFRKNDSNCYYQSAPVKKYERCVIKATTDYAKQEFPSVASILDFLRFSATV